MDPFQEFTDVDLWQALEKCHIKDMVSQCRAAVPMETGNLNRNSLMFFILQVFVMTRWLKH